MAQQDACTLLDDEHNEVMGMFEEYKAAHDGHRQELLAAKINQSLQVHMKIEEEIFYPAFRRATGDDYRTDDGLREHKEARELLAKIDGDRQNAKLMLELEEAIRHHINDEREKMFPEARKTPSLDLMKLGEQLAARKAELLAGVPA